MSDPGPIEPAVPGHFWKTPFLWEPGCPAPAATPMLRFEPADPGWLVDALSEVMTHSVDASDQHAVARYGPRGAAEDLLAIEPSYFEHEPCWWRKGVQADGAAVGFVLPVLFRDRSRWRDGQPQGTIFYVGVLPGQRGHGHGHALLAEATRLFIGAGCWRIFCDTASVNAPMIAAFRRAGWIERTPWQRPVD